MSRYISRRSLLGASLLSATGAILASPSYAAKRFAVVSVTNETRANLTIVFRWGNEPWQRKNLPAGDKHWFAWRYSRPDEDRSPDLFVKFDADAGVSRYTEEKRLHGYAAEDETFELGHLYAFRYDGPAKRYIEIWDVSGPGIPNGGRPAPSHGTRLD